MGREDEEARVRDDNDSASTKQSVPVPSYVLVRDNDCQIVREYTPITYETNHVDLLIKCYPEGSMSSKLTHLVSGDEIDLRGPELHPGFDLAGVKEIGMVAGGTGITPMYQLIKYILTQAPHAADTRLSLVYTNAYEVDILLRKELDLLQQHFPSRFKVTYVLDYPPSPQWPGWRGFVGQQVLQESLPSPLRDHEVKILVAGPDGLVKHVAGEKTTFQEQGPLRGLLARLGYHADQVYKF
ncbi:hypothetical protein CXG81DRAFT_12030 [Caulochytrium protostelioides]|uniref:NADH-cytochrome b5 reductase n=1 Tax=Caulochytrium protostelioides TaxID=1555241 RepID=A0A4V1IUQ8_9FUNG|nr:hypothetical protein CXG81DRAFT_12030 [Caulochytrium protostelioides]|eukprot:RKP01409.1 hypothetical protein CXG81DRAFT_12030 [Caulochytrium protostelioides]